MQTHPSNFILDIYIYIYKIFPIPQFSITILKLSIQQGRKEIGVSNISAHLQPIFVNNRFFSRYCPLELAERSRIFADRAFADTTPALLTSCYYSPVKIPDLFVDLPILITLYFSLLLLYHAPNYQLFPILGARSVSFFNLHPPPSSPTPSHFFSTAIIIQHSIKKNKKCIV